jgi:hypothetical protein
MYSGLKTIIAVMMGVVILLFSINVAHEVEDETAPASHHISLETSHSESTTHCPDCPLDHQNTNHDHDSYDHHNYTSLVHYPPSFSPNPVITLLPTFEQFRAIPEVYLDIFIPPQSRLA